MNINYLLNNNFVDGVGYVISKDDMDDFLNENVIIPRGENRHPYADLFHEWVENTNLKLEYFHKFQKQWYELNLEVTMEDEVRMKLKEPTYEYQWKYRMRGGVKWLGFTEFLTEAELSDPNISRPPFEYERDESTKRIRA